MHKVESPCHSRCCMLHRQWHSCSTDNTSGAAALVVSWLLLNDGQRCRVGRVCNPILDHNLFILLPPDELSQGRQRQLPWHSLQRKHCRWTDAAPHTAGDAGIDTRRAMQIVTFHGTLASAPICKCTCPRQVSSSVWAPSGGQLAACCCCSALSKWTGIAGCKSTPASPSFVCTFVALK